MIAGSTTQAGLKIIVLAILARLVTPDEFGIIGIALIVIGFSQLFIYMGIGPALVQRKELEERHLTTGFTVSLFTGISFSILLVLLAPFISHFFRMDGLIPVLRVISVVFFINTLTLIGQSLLQRNMNFKEIAKINILSFFFGYGATGVIMAYLGFGVWALVGANIAQAILITILTVKHQKFPKRLSFDIDAFKDLMFFGGGMTISRVANYIAMQGDNLVAGRTLGAASLGIYGRAYQLMVMPAELFGSALDKALFPAMAQVQDDKKKLAEAYMTGINAVALISIPLSVLFVFLAPEIVTLLLGKNWNGAIVPFQYLSIILLFRMSYKISDSLSRAVGAVYRRAWRQIIYATAILLFSWIGQHNGLPGLAMGVSVAVTMNFLLMAHLSLDILDISWMKFFGGHLKGLYLGIITSVLMGVFLYLFRDLLSSSLLVILLSLILFLGTMLLIIRYFPKFFIDKRLTVLIVSQLSRFNSQNRFLRKLVQLFES